MKLISDDIDIKCDFADEVNKLHPELPMKLQSTILNLIECVAQVQLEADQKVLRGIKKELNGLIIGIDNCKFEERLDGDKGCIVLDMNENQWQKFWQKYGGE
ncbi:hypothetical protein LCGC14_0922500 [marine sediment metagenome]|uniref:Uncharacterized protein n=1 Tax=marine sediment metagenome TaxID=412755 RepID=A0A0F9NQB8_9ZZZZ